MSLPTGTVTFLLTDVEASTRLWEDFPDVAGGALARHDEIIEDAVAAHDGAVVRPRGEGDSRFCVFARASDGVAAALAIQRAFGAEPWPGRPVRIRMALHTGEAELRAGDYYGTAVNRCARLRGIAHGGQTLLSRATTELVAAAMPSRATLRDLGDHVLRDIAHPERVFQLCHPDLPSEFPPLLSLDERRNNLPSELSSFIGRESEVKEVKRLLGATRLLTLHGAAGCGKTRLALEVADELIGAFPDGVWFVDLAPLTEPTLIVEAVANALGITEARLPMDEGVDARDIGERVLDHLRARSVLLVLDNCEHLVRPTADLIDRILRSCPDVRLVATSREALGIASEVAWKVPSLSVPPEDDAPTYEELSRWEACKLFVERARQRRPHLWIEDTDAEAIASICRRLDGIPLAIELAAARVKLLTPRQIDERLNERFRLLVGGSRTALERQQTLRATVDWSYEPLTEPERALFRRLGVFAGGFTLEAVESVCAGDDVPDGSVLDLLSSLVDKSLVEAEPGADDGIRYRMLETFRQYAREKLLEAGDVARVRERHLAWFGGLAERAAVGLEGGEQLRWLNRLEVEHDNLRAALEWAASEGTEASGRLVGALWFFWLIRGHTSEGRQWCASALRGAEGWSPAVRADALRAAAALAWAAYDLADASALAKEWADAATASGDRRRIGHSLIGLGYLPMLQGDLAGARARWREAVDIGREVGDVSLVLNALALLAEIDLIEGNADRARETLEQLLREARAADDLFTIASACSTLASQHRMAGDYAAAERYLEECLATSRQLDDHTQIARALIGMAAIARHRGDLARARELIEEGRRLRRETSMPALLWTLQLARVEEATGDLDAAERLFGEVRGADVPAGARPAAEVGLARVALARDDPDRALALARGAVRRYVELGVRASVPDALAAVAGAFTRTGRPARAVRLFGAVEALRRAFREVVHPDEQDAYEGDIGRARAALPAERFEEEWLAGGALTLEAAVAYALETHPAA